MATSDRAVLITGTSSGIGQACVARMARAGFTVFASVRRAADADALRAAHGDRVVPVTFDVTDEAAIAAAVATVRERRGDAGLDGLVNNAGIGVTMPVEYVPLDVLRRQFEVNVFGQVAVTQAFLPLVRRARGRVVNIGSVGGHITIPFGGALCASKHALRSLNDALRLELHPAGVRVCLVEPGSIHTPAVDKTLGDVEGTIARLPADGAQRYGDRLREFTRRAMAREAGGSAPAVVADAVHHALTATAPRTRYPVGRDAWLLETLARVLPDRALDRVRFRVFGQPAGFGSDAPASWPMVR